MTPKPKEQSFREWLQAQEFYNPGVTRYLKLGDKEVDQILSELAKRLERAKPKMAEPTSGLKRTYNNGIEDYEAAIKRELQ